MLSSERSITVTFVWAVTVRLIYAHGPVSLGWLAQWNKVHFAIAY